jgi:hypothetical protein
MVAQISCLPRIRVCNIYHVVVLEGNPARMIVISTRLGLRGMANEPSTTTNKKNKAWFHLVLFVSTKHDVRAVCWSWRRLRHGASSAFYTNIVSDNLGTKPPYAVVALDR